MGVTNPRQKTDFHVTPGRLRVRSPMMRRNPERARGAERELAALPGVTLARVNATTGSILLHFATPDWSAEALLALLSHRGYLDRDPASEKSSARRDPDLFTACCALIGKEILCAAISQAFPHPVISLLLAVL